MQAAELLKARRDSRVLNQEATQRLADVNLSVPEFEVLYWLAIKGPMQQSELVRRSGATKASVSEIVADLYADGAVARRTDPDDGRGRIVRLTEEGKRVFGLAMEALR